MINYRNEYPYDNMELTGIAAKYHIQNQFVGKKSTSKREIINKVVLCHERFGGSETPIDSVEQRVGNALINGLPHALAKGTVRGDSFWSINLFDIGHGDKFVYCWYYERDQEEAFKNKRIHWRCNIGRNDSDPVERIKAQIDKSRGEYIIAVVARTDNNHSLETDIHDVLKQEGRQIKDKGKNEDFMTCPAEVAQILYGSTHIQVDKPKKVNFYPHGFYS